MLRKKDLYVKPFRTDLSIAEEIQAVANFIASKWEPVENLPALVKVVQEAAFHDSRASFDGLDVGAYTRGIADRRRELLGNLMENPIEKAYAPMFDGPSKALSSFLTHISYYAEAGLDVDRKWDYTRQVKAAQIKVERSFPDVARAVPAGWESFKTLVDNDEADIDYALKADNEAFAGSKIETHRSLSLVEQLALHNLHYGDDSHGRKPQYALIGAIYSHFSNIQQKLNTHNLMMAIDRMTNWDLPEHRFEIPTLDGSGSVLAQLLISKVDEPYTEAMFREAVNSRLEHDALPDQEREALKKARHNEMMAEMNADYWKVMDAKIASEKAASLIELRKAFGTHKEKEIEAPSL